MYRRRQERAQIRAAVILFFLICIPVWLIRGCVAANSSNSEEDASLTPGPSPTVEVWDKETGSLMNMDIEEYIVGVVAAEIPSSFDMEALKAQAVAARTYTVRKMHAYGGSGCSKGGDVCTDSAHCQAYRKLDSTWQGTEKERGSVRLSRPPAANCSSMTTSPLRPSFTPQPADTPRRARTPFPPPGPILRAWRATKPRPPAIPGKRR